MEMEMKTNICCDHANTHTHAYIHGLILNIRRQSNISAYIKYFTIFDEKDDGVQES